MRKKQRAARDYVQKTKGMIDDDINTGDMEEASLLAWIGKITKLLRHSNLQQMVTLLLVALIIQQNDLMNLLRNLIHNNLRYEYRRSNKSHERRS